MKSTITFLFLFFITSILIGCGEEIKDKDPDNISVNQKQRRDILQERHNIQDRGNPIFEASLGETAVAKGDTDASGYMTLVIQGDSVHIKGEFSGLSSPYTESYIHEVIQSSRIQALKPSLNESKTAGTWEDTYTFDKEELEKLKNDSLYVSVYSEKYKEEGEIRAQITNWDSVAAAAPVEEAEKQNQEQ